MNQVIMRSLNTSIVALIPVISMLVIGAGILGAVTLEEFAIALTVGLFVGAYSSIFIAAPVVTWMKEREPRNRQLRARIEAQQASSRQTDEGDGPGEGEAGDEVAVGAANAGGSSSSGAGSRPAASRRVAPSTGTGATTIPPRPRKKTKKR
jgi:preprotein translocase subunit SecF